MAKHKLMLTYPFKYRFQCEHCGQTTEWKDVCFKGETETDEDDKEARLNIENNFKKEFYLYSLIGANKVKITKMQTYI